MAFFRGEGSKICQICQWIVVKKLPTEGGRGQKSWNLPTSSIDGPKWCCTHINSFNLMKLYLYASTNVLVVHCTKFLSLLEACFDLILLPCYQWKIKSWAGKLLKIWGSNPYSGRSKKMFVPFLFIFKSSIKTTYLCVEPFFNILFYK